MNFTRVKITVFSPLKNADDIREAVGQAGGGVIGDYTFCSFSAKGQGRFKPSADADPYIGQPGRLEIVDEERIEITCSRNEATKILDAIKSAHPYEEPAYDIIPLIDESDL